MLRVIWQFDWENASWSANLQLFLRAGSIVSTAHTPARQYDNISLLFACTLSAELDDCWTAFFVALFSACACGYRLFCFV